MKNLAKQAGIIHEELYKALRHNSSDRFDKISRVINVLRLKITKETA